jgi:phage gp29-like protein
VNKHIDQILDAVLFGFDVEEIVWELSERKYRPVALNQKPVDWFIFNRENELRLRKMVGGSYVFEKGVKLPEYKFILSQHKPSYTNPYGQKLLSKVYWSVTFKKASIDNWEQLLAKHGMPYIVGRYPSTATDTDKDELEEAITQMLDNNLAMMNNDVEVDFKEGGKYNVGAIYENMVDFLNREISKAVLTVTLTTELGSTGSYKAVEIHRKMLEMIGLQDKKIVERAFSKLIEFYVEVNHGKRVKYPELVLEKKEDIVEATVARDKTLTEMGIEFTKDYYRKRYNLNEEDFVIQNKLKS